MPTERGKLAWDLFSELRKELVESQRIRTQIIGFKITLVSAAVGVIATKPHEVPQALLVLPAFAAFFFDLLIHGYAFSIKRIGYYCRWHLEPLIKKEFELPKDFVLWEAFLRQPLAYQPHTFRGNLGLTLLTSALGARAAVANLPLIWSVPILVALGILLLIDSRAYRTIIGFERRPGGTGTRRRRRAPVHLRFLWVYPHLNEPLHQLYLSLLLVLFLSLHFLAHRQVTGYKSEVLRLALGWLEYAGLLLFVLFLIATVVKFFRLLFGKQDRAEPAALLNLPNRDDHTFSSPSQRYVIRQVRKLPDDPKRPHSDDIEIFVQMAMAAPGVADAHSELTPENRQLLYQFWWRCNPNSLLLLELLDEDGEPNVVAVSIVLPLTKAGAAALISQRRSALDLQIGEIAAAGRRPRQLLLDTWIVSPNHRKEYSPFKTALVLKHLSLFWRMRDRHIQIFAEPDTDNMKRHLKAWGFQRIKRKKGADLFVIDLGDPTTTPSHARVLRQVADSIQIMRAWPLSQA